MNNVFNELEEISRNICDARNQLVFTTSILEKKKLIKELKSLVNRLRDLNFDRELLILIHVNNLNDDED